MSCDFEYCELRGCYVKGHESLILQIKSRVEKWYLDFLPQVEVWFIGNCWLETQTGTTMQLTN